MKIKQILCAALVAAMGATSCSREEITSSAQQSGSNVIGFTTYAPATSKGVAINSAEDMQGSSKIGVYAFIGDSEEPFMGENGTVEGSDDTQTNTWVRLTYTDADGWDYWLDEERKYWSQVEGGETVTFHAIFPYLSANEDVEYTPTEGSFTGANPTYYYSVPVGAESEEPIGEYEWKSGDQKDVMYARTEVTKPEDGTLPSAVQLDFQHALSQVLFKARVHDDSPYAVHVKKITIHNLKQAGTLSLPTKDESGNDVAASWSLEETLADYPLAMSDTDVTKDDIVELTNSSCALLILPQTFSAWDKTATAADEGVYIAVECYIGDEEAGVDLFGTRTNNGDEDDLEYTYEYQTLYIPLSGTWEMGKCYTYTLVFGDPNGNNGFDEDGNEIEFGAITFAMSATTWVDQTGDNLVLEQQPRWKQLGIETVLVEAANQTFTMGTSDEDISTYNLNVTNEKQKSVIFTKSYYMSKYEITMQQFCDFLNDIGLTATGVVADNYTFTGEDAHLGTQSLLVMGSALHDAFKYDSENGWQAATEGEENYPAYFISWYGAYAYAKWAGGSLPTEAQWEYACRAGSTTLYPFGNSATDEEGEDLLAQYASYKKSSSNPQQAVGQLLPNAWGLYDMLGGAAEWCLDYYVDDYSDSSIDPETGNLTANADTQTQTTHTLRGGSFSSNATSVRSAARKGTNSTSEQYGFRVIFPAE